MRPLFGLRRELSRSLRLERRRLVAVCFRNPIELS